ncbi:MAG: hypothetical protein WED34_16290 [Planctomycetales bacterium]
MPVATQVLSRTDLPRDPAYGDPGRLGETRLVPPASIGRTVLVLGGALAASLALTGWLGSGRAESFTGYLQAETATLSAARSGRMIELLIAEGQPVEPGAAVAMLLDEDATARVAEQTRKVAALVAELARAQAEADVDTAWRLKAIESEILQTRLQSAEYLKQKLQHELEGLAWSEFAAGGLAQAGGAGKGFEPIVFERWLPEEARLRALLRQDAARNAIEVHQAQAELCDERLLQLEELQAKLPEEIHRASGVEEVASRLAEAREELARLEALEAKFPLASSAYGILGTFRRGVGQAIRAGEPVVEVFDGQRSHLTVQVPSQRAPDYAPGTDVSLLFPGGEGRSGRVASVQPQAVRPQDAGLLFAGEDALVSVRIEPTGKLWPASPVGSAVRVTVRER